MSDETDPLEAALARARSPGTFVHARPFTLSRERAVEKQREFALRHPSQVVLELVQAAVFAGATAVAIETRPDLLMVAWTGGRRPTEEQLESWLDHLFADRRRAELRPMIQLSTSLNALLERHPRRLSVETGDGERAVRLELDPDGGGRIGPVDEALDATFVVASLRQSLWGRLTSSEVTEELRLIEERCLYTPVPIFLNGRAPFGYRPTRHIEIFGADHQVHFDDGRRRGVVATHLHPTASTGFRAVVGGVWITTLPLPELGASRLLGVVCDDDLRKTADHADIVQDQRYVELLHAVQPHATEVLRHRDASYEPPNLPALAAEGAASTSGIDPQPLPDDLPSLPGRRPLPRSVLDDFRDTLFVVAPGQREALSTSSLSPAHFPFPVAVLEDGQVLTLAEIASQRGFQVHRLTSAGDVEFLRRALDRERRVRRVEGRAGDDLVRLVRYHGGAVPDGGTGVRGWPYQVTLDDELMDAGVLTPTGRHRSVPREPVLQAMDLPTLLHGVWLQVELSAEQVSTRELTPHHVHAALDIAWGLVVADPDAEDLEGVDPPLLAALLGGVLTCASDAQLELPYGWPSGLLGLPLPGGPSARDLAGDAHEQHVRDVSDSVAAHLLPVAARTGVGWLRAPLVDRPILGVGHLAGHWTWLEGDMWQHPELSALCVVVGHHGTVSLPGWTAREGPRPLLVALVRDGQDRPPTDAAWELLDQRLARVAAGVEAPATEHDLRWLRALAATALGDPPSVVGPARWVVERPVRLGSAHGVVGLRHPFVDERSVSLRSLSARTHRSWSDGPPFQGTLHHVGPLRPDLVDDLRLAALGLDQDLLAALDDPFPDERQDTVRAYAIDRVLRAHRHGPLQGLAAELARRVELHEADGTPWGSLHQWLDSDPARRPSLPVPEPPPSDRTAEELQDVVRAVLAGAAPLVVVERVAARSGCVWVNEATSHLGQLNLELRRDHPLVEVAAAGPGRQRELLLLELARVACEWTRVRSVDLDLDRVHARLLARRMG